MGKTGRKSLTTESESIPRRMILKQHLLEPVAGLDRHVDGAHASMADLANDPVGPECARERQKKVAGIAPECLTDGFSQIESRQVARVKGSC